MPRKRPAPVESLDEVLKALAAPAAAALCQPLEDSRVRCVACGHRCRIPDGLDGICKVRFNRAGRLYAPRGYVAGLQVDPIEKKPFYHAFPGSDALSFGMLGCDLHCPYCQNWLTSQTLRDDSALSRPRPIAAGDLVDLAVSRRAPVVVSTYNEPLITSEWAVEVFREARERGLVCGYVSNGNATPEVLDYLRPWVELFKVDLKGFRKETYRQLGGTLERVTESIRGLFERGYWVEVVTLLVPGFNDSREELTDLCGFLASVSPDIPWHVTAFHRDYRMTGPADTTVRDLRRAAEIGAATGLRHVYAGNRPGDVGDLEHTRCHACGDLLVKRFGFQILENRFRTDGVCPSCGTAAAGYWSARSRVPATATTRWGRPPRSVDPVQAPDA